MAAGCAIEIADLPVLQGCPSSTELVLVMNATGGSGAGLYALRKWGDIRTCVLGTPVLPYIGVVGRGQVSPTKDPVAGQSILQDNSLINLGSTNNGNIQIVIAETLMSNYGENKSFNYNPVIGEIDISPNVFIMNDAVFVDRNQ